MKDSDKKILIVIAAIGILVAAFMLVIKPKRQEIKSVQSQIIDLQARLDDLTAKEAQKDQFIQETKEFNEQFDEIVAKYPADLNQESTVMFMKGVEEANEFVNDSIALPRDTVFYVLGQGEISARDTVEVDEEGTEPYVCSQDAYSIAYNGSYKGLKDYLDYIANYKYRMAISSVAINYNADAANPVEECAGNIMLNAYAISGPDRVADKPTVSVKEGKDNIFFGEIGAAAGAAVSYDSDQGNGIATNHNIVILLNNANNDTSSGIIVASNESSEDTYVSSSANSVQNLDIQITEEDGKKYITYSIGADSKKSEILSSDVTIFVKSSARVDSNDTNGVDVTINNSTDLGVYIKVSDDDSSSPRFNVKSKTGTVKVY
ncbi:hypothetical protein SAMN06297422_11147 [Lachnospiraceae bacterium]|nr:hypothetical protein SAMN06297422_11147 [Lachnospiraceae bacterium]